MQSAGRLWSTGRSRGFRQSFQCFNTEYLYCRALAVETSGTKLWRNSASAFSSMLNAVMGPSCNWEAVCLFHRLFHVYSFWSDVLALMVTEGQVQNLPSLKTSSFARKLVLLQATHSRSSFRIHPTDKLTQFHYSLFPMEMTHLSPAPCWFLRKVWKPKSYLLLSWDFKYVNNTGWTQKHSLISSSYKIKTYWNIFINMGLQIH